MPEGGDNMTFSELRQKDVINICDGRRMGRPFDIILNDRACIEAIMVPVQCGFAGLFRGEKDGITIGWDCIRRIGDDVILVEIQNE